MRKKFTALTTLTAAAALAATAFAAQPASADPPPASGCADVEVVAVRGTNESTPIGILGVLANRVTATSTKTVATYGLPYPATQDWVSSVNSGKALLAEHLATQSTACPSQEFVLLGYSQGAWVVGDSLAGGGGGFPPPVSAALGQKVSAVVMYGDPRYRSGEPFLAGTAPAAGSTINGIIPRDAGALATYASRTRSYCELDDPFCQYGGPGGNGHFVYTGKYTNDAAAFVVAHL